MIKILHFSTSVSTGGAERMLVKILRETQGAEFNHRVVSLMHLGSQAPEIEAAGVPVSSLNMRQGKPSLRALLQARAVVRDFNPDLIIGWMYHAALLSMLVRQGCPVVGNIRHSLHDIRCEKKSVQAVIRLLKWYSPRMAGILYCSHRGKEQHRDFGYKNSLEVVIPNGVDCEEFKPDPQARQRVRAMFGIPQEAVVVGHLGRFHPMKGHNTFFEALEKIRVEFPDVWFVVGGPDVHVENHAFMKISAGRGLEGRLKIVGEQHDMAAALNAVDVYCLSSGWGESWPNVLGEAMAVGVPCVTTDVGDSGRIVGDTGWAVEPQNSEALANALRAALTESQEQRVARSQRARERIDGEYSMRRAAVGYADLFRRATVGPSQRRGDARD